MRTKRALVLSAIAFLLLPAVSLVAQENNTFDSACKTALANEWHTLRVATANYEMNGSQSVDDVLIKVQDILDQSESENVDLIVFPELWVLDGLDLNRPEIPQFSRIANEYNQPILDLISHHSRVTGTHIQAGTFPVAKDGTFVNRSYFFFPDGRVFTQDKLFLTPDEENWQWQEGQTVDILPTPWGPTASLTCYDCEIPRISNALADHDVLTIVVPSMTGSAGQIRVQWTALSRAIEHKAYVVVSGVYGDEENSWSLQGQTLVVGPSQDSFAHTMKVKESDYSNLITTTDLDIRELKRIRNTRSIFPAQAQRNRTLPVTINDSPSGSTRDQ